MHVSFLDLGRSDCACKVKCTSNKYSLIQIYVESSTNSPFTIIVVTVRV